jgi:hypothetical protein
MIAFSRHYSTFRRLLFLLFSIALISFILPFLTLYSASQRLIFHIIFISLTLLIIDTLISCLAIFFSASLTLPLRRCHAIFIEPFRDIDRHYAELFHFE